MSNVSHTISGSFLGPARIGIFIARGFGPLAALIDVAIVVGTSTLAGAGYHLFAYGVVGPMSHYLVVGLFVAVIYSGLRCFDSRYRSERLDLEKDRLKSILLTWNVAFLCLFAVGFLMKETDAYSRGALAVFYVSGVAALMGGRALMWSVLRLGFENGWFIAKRVFLYGTRTRIEQFLARYQPAGNGLRVAGVWYLPDHLEDRPAQNSIEVRANLKQAIDYARALKIDDIFIVAPWSSREIVVESTKAFLAIPASIHLTPERHFDTFSDLQISHVGPAACLRLARPPLSIPEIVAKRIVDIVLASVGLLLLWPLLVLIGVLIYLESGRPVIFMQRRHGFNEREFRILKFRTMSVLEDGPSVRQACKDDTRLTRVGRFLRRWNLDELPQLVNVLRGNMSIVGPRPHALAHNQEFVRRIAHYARRHNVKPGITGWAQVNGLRGETDTEAKMQARVEHDLHYIDNWSLTFDLYIILLTLVSRKVHWNAH